ncbi:hypothetical protein AAMO2058_000143200 [Amorphochlora amoebiformis]
MATCSGHAQERCLWRAVAWILALSIALGGQLEYFTRPRRHGIVSTGDKKWSNPFFRAPKRTAYNIRFTWEDLKKMPPEERSFYIGQSEHHLPKTARKQDVRWFMNDSQILDFVKEGPKMGTYKKDLERERKKDAKRMAIALGVQEFNSDPSSESEKSEHRDSPEMSRRRHRRSSRSTRRSRKHESGHKHSHKTNSDAGHSHARRSRHHRHRTHRSHRRSNRHSKSSRERSASRSPDPKTVTRKEEFKDSSLLTTRKAESSFKAKSPKPSAKKSMSLGLPEVGEEKLKEHREMQETLTRDLGGSFGWGGYLAQKFEYAGTFQNVETVAPQGEEAATDGGANDLEPSLGTGNEKNWMKVSTTLDEQLGKRTSTVFGPDRLAFRT